MASCESRRKIFTVCGHQTVRSARCDAHSAFLQSQPCVLRESFSVRFGFCRRCTAAFAPLNLRSESAVRHYWAYKQAAGWAAPVDAESVPLRFLMRMPEDVFREAESDGAQRRCEVGMLEDIIGGGGSGRLGMACAGERLRAATLEWARTTSPAPEMETPPVSPEYGFARGSAAAVDEGTRRAATAAILAQGSEYGEAGSFGGPSPMPLSPSLDIRTNTEERPRSLWLHKETYEALTGEKLSDSETESPSSFVFTWTSESPIPLPVLTPTSDPQSLAYRRTKRSVGHLDLSRCDSNRTFRKPPILWQPAPLRAGQVGKPRLSRLGDAAAEVCFLLDYSSVQPSLCRVDRARQLVGDDGPKSASEIVRKGTWALNGAKADHDEHASGTGGSRSKSGALRAPRRPFHRMIACSEHGAGAFAPGRCAACAVTDLRGREKVVSTQGSDALLAMGGRRIQSAPSTPSATCSQRQAVPAQRAICFCAEIGRKQGCTVCEAAAAERTSVNVDWI